MKHGADYEIEMQGENVSFSNRSRRRDNPDMDITPMIDITFLLLIFFLVAARMTDEAFVQLPPAKNGTAVSSETSVIVTLTKGTGEDAIVYKGDGAAPETRVTATSLQDQQVELESYIENGLTVDSKQQVLIKAEEGVRHRDVARVARAAGEATASVLYIAVVEQR